MKKYKKRSNSIDADFRHYLGNECLFHYFFGQVMTKAERAKVAYIWKALLAEHAFYKQPHLR